MKRFTAVLCWVFLTNLLSAQTIITGSVKDEGGDVIAGAIVTVKDAEKTVAFAITKSDGSFKLTVNSEKKELQISASMMSYAKEERVIENLTQTLDFVLKEEKTQLKEAVVSAPVVTRIGDTLRFNLPALVSRGDVSLEDALKKVPGISVAESGEIRYLGRAISNFYVEGLEMLNGNYTLATKNLPAEHVASVEVLNNHQAIKMDQNKISDNVALNVKLKKDAMFKPVGTSEVAGGYSAERLLYTIGATGMVFGKKAQAIVSAKTGNIDDFAVSQTTVRTLATGPSATHLAVNAIGALNGNAPLLSKSRYLTIDGRLVTANTILKLTEEKTLRINTSYAWQREKNRYSSSSLYYLGDEDYLTLALDSEAMCSTHMPKLNIEYTQNSAGKYLRNTFNYSGDFSDNALPVVENGTAIDQRENVSSYFISDDFMWSFRTGKWEWSSLTQLQYAKTPTLRLDVSSTHAPYNASQTASSRTFNIYQQLSTSYSWKRFRFYLPITLDVKDHLLETGLNKDGLLAENMVKGIDGNLLVRPNVSYDSPDNRLKSSLSLGLRGVLVKGNDALGNSPLQDYSRIDVNPSFNMTYTISPESDLQLNSSMSHNYGDFTSLLANPFMQNYRSVLSRPGILAQNRIASMSLSWRYSNPISLWFGSWRLGYTDTHSNLMSSMFITDDTSSSSSVQSDNHSRTVSANADITKRISSIGGKFVVRGGWNWSQSGIIQQNALVTYYGRGVNAGADININPVKWLEADMSVNWRLTNSSYSSVQNTYKNLTGKAKLSFFVLKGLVIQTDMDYSHLQLSDGSYKDLALFDASASYKIKQFTIKLSANNLLDQKAYSYTVFNGLNIHSYDFALRPREVVLSIQFTM